MEEKGSGNENEERKVHALVICFQLKMQQKWKISAGYSWKAQISANDREWRFISVNGNYGDFMVTKEMEE